MTVPMRVPGDNDGLFEALRETLIGLYSMKATHLRETVLTNVKAVIQPVDKSDNNIHIGFSNLQAPVECFPTREDVLAYLHNKEAGTCFNVYFSTN